MVAVLELTRSRDGGLTEGAVDMISLRSHGNLRHIGRHTKYLLSTSVLHLPLRDAETVPTLYIPALWALTRLLARHVRTRNVSS